MLRAAAKIRARMLAHPITLNRMFATKLHVVKATTVKIPASSSASAYVSRARATAKAPAASNTTVTRSRLNDKKDSSPGGNDAAPSSTRISTAHVATASRLSFTPSSPMYASTSPTSSYPIYSDESVPGATSPGNATPVGGDTSESQATAFAKNNTLKEALIGDHGSEDGQDWTRSFAGMAIEPFEKDVADILMKPLDPADIEIKPDGLLYLPEIKYRRILNQAFGPGGWGLAPRSEHSISPKNISREYALICRGRFVSTARGEQDYFDISNLATASEGCKSNALMRCCKDLGIASELWDPSFIRKFKKQHCDEQFVEHAITKKRKKLWKRKDQSDFDYPYSKAK
ncbi:MAG: mitochondrial genome maintenance MGM101-domain-containing protein [Podila humilis]|nr:MAG: mitochondrial genome maintenance MGM101-domain-containing protein [Podila humilis]